MKNTINSIVRMTTIGMVLLGVASNGMACGEDGVAILHPGMRQVFGPVTACEIWASPTRWDTVEIQPFDDLLPATYAESPKLVRTLEAEAVLPASTVLETTKN